MFEGESAASLASRLPRTRRGYDLSATDLLLATLLDERAKLAEECDRLQEHIASLEGDEELQPPDVDHQPRDDELVGRTLLAATSFAMKVREEARREAALILRNASSRAAEGRIGMERVRREREAAEQELLRLRQLTQEMQAGLAGFLASTLRELRSGQAHEGEIDHDMSAPRMGEGETLVDALNVAAPLEED
jgi:cell division septum initiation protein DivIVA